MPKRPSPLGRSPVTPERREEAGRLLRVLGVCPPAPGAGSRSEGGVSGSSSSSAPAGGRSVRKLWKAALRLPDPAPAPTEGSSALVTGAPHCASRLGRSPERELTGFSQEIPKT